MPLKALVNVKGACVEMPGAERAAVLKEAVLEHHEALEDAHCVMDGSKLHFESCEGLGEQSMFCNGWQHDHCISNLFVSGVDGQIALAIVNAPGSAHGSTLAHWGKAHSCLEEHCELTGRECCVDSAFVSGEDVPCLVESAQDVSKVRTALEMAQMEQATSL